MDVSQPPADDTVDRDRGAEPIQRSPEQQCRFFRGPAALNGQSSRFMGGGHHRSARTHIRRLQEKVQCEQARLKRDFFDFVQEVRGSLAGCFYRFICLCHFRNSPGAPRMSALG